MAPWHRRETNVPPAEKAAAAIEDDALIQKKQKKNKNKGHLKSERVSLGQASQEAVINLLVKHDDCFSSDDESITEGSSKYMLHLRGVSSVKFPPIIYKSHKKYGSAGMALANALDDNVWFYEQTSIGGKLAGAIYGVISNIKQAKEQKANFLQNCANMISKFISPLYMWHLVDAQAELNLMKYHATFPVVVVLPNHDNFNGFCVANGWIYDARREYALPFTKENLMMLGYFQKNEAVATQDQHFDLAPNVRHYAVVMNHDWVKQLLIKHAQGKGRDDSAGASQYGTPAHPSTVAPTEVTSSNSNYPQNNYHSNHDQPWGKRRAINKWFLCIQTI